MRGRGEQGRGGREGEGRKNGMKREEKMQGRERKGERKAEEKWKEKGKENKMERNVFCLGKEEEIKECKPTVCSSFSWIYPAPRVACPALFDLPDKYCVCLCVELWWALAFLGLHNRPVYRRGSVDVTRCRADATFQRRTGFLDMWGAALQLCWCCWYPDTVQGRWMAKQPLVSHASAWMTQAGNSRSSRSANILTSWNDVVECIKRSIWDTWPSKPQEFCFVWWSPTLWSVIPPAGGRWISPVRFLFIFQC